MEENKFNLIELVLICKRWWKHIFITCIIAAIGSSIISLVMPEYYKSTAVFYPYNPKLSDPRTLYVKDINYDIFGNGDDIDRLITIAHSSLIHRDMIREFGLIEHYGIDTGELALTDALEEFDDNFDFIKNDEGALEITIYDTDAELAAEMVKIMTGKINYINIETIKKNNEKLIKVYESHMKSKQEEIISITDSLKRLRITNDIYVPLSKLNLNKINEISSDKSIDQISSLESQLEYLNNEYSTAKENYSQTLSTVENFVQSLYITEEAVTAKKKAKPIRWLIVATTILLSFILATFFAVIVDFYRNEIKSIVE